MARKEERELEEGLRCRERHCIDPIRFKWNPRKCYCELRKACPNACAPVNPETCACTNKFSMQQFVSEYHDKWNKNEDFSVDDKQK